MFETVWSGLSVSHPAELVDFAKVLEDKGTATQMYQAMALSVRDHVVSDTLMDALKPFLGVPQLWSLINNESARAAVGLPSPETVAQSVLTWAEDGDLVAAAWQQIHRGESAGLAPLFEELSGRGLLDQCDANGKTLATLAIDAGNPDIVLLLRRFGARF